MSHGGWPITSGKVRACVATLSFSWQVVPGLWLTLRCTGSATAAFGGFRTPVSSNVRQQMEVPVARPDPSALAAVARQCVQLLCAGEFDALAQSFGYAVALGREPSSAIATDLATSLREVGASALVIDAEPQTTVKPSTPGQYLLAVVECALLTNNDRRVLVELVATESGGRTHVSLEQISAAA